MTQLHRWAHRSIVVLLIALTTLVPSRAWAQDQEQSSFVKDLFKGVVLDPTTYAPAIIAYDATMRDWNSSQPFFQRGYFERNPRFTISGRPNDFAVSYDAGRERILGDAWLNLQASLVNNVADRLFERALMTRFPERRKLVRTLGWIERVSFASYFAYRQSAAHYRQAAANEQRALQLGYR